MKTMLALIAALSMSFGCATMLDLSKDMCDLLVGGSKLEKLCPQLDKLGGDEEVPAE